MEIIPTRRFLSLVRLKHFIVFLLNKEDLDSILLFVFCVSSLKYGKVNGDELDQIRPICVPFFCRSLENGVGVISTKRRVFNVFLQL